MISGYGFRQYLKLRLPQYSRHRPRGFRPLRNKKVYEICELIDRSPSKTVCICLDGGMTAGWAIRQVRLLLSAAIRRKLVVERVISGTLLCWDGYTVDNTMKNKALIVFSPKPELKTRARGVSSGL